MKALYFKEVSFCFPFLLSPETCTCVVSHVQGRQHQLLMEIEVKLPQPLEVSGPDPGSKQWLITRALLQNDNPYASEEDVGVKSHPKEDKTENTGGALPEERFHLSLPENVDQYTGAALDNAIQREEEEELPEDRFHRKDASSAYILEQRAKALQDKADKYER